MNVLYLFFVVCSLSLHTLSFGEAKVLRRVLVRSLGKEANQSRKPPPSSGGGGSGSGGSATASADHSSGKGDSGGGGSSAATTSEGTSHGSRSGNSSSASTSNAGGSRNRASHNNVKSVSGEHSKVGVIIPIGAAALVCVVLVAASFRRTTVKAAHPLKGSISRRMNLFNDMAKHNPSTSRPPRRVEDVYTHAPGGTAGV